MADNIRRRFACDRCHSHKLKCPRQPGVAVCDRCLKAKKSCAYSPFRQKKPLEGDRATFSSASEPTLPLVSRSPDQDDASIRLNGRALQESQLDQLASTLIAESLPDQIDPAFADGINLDYPYPALGAFDANDSIQDFGIDIPSEYTPFYLDPMSPFFRPDMSPRANESTRFKSPTPPSLPNIPHLSHDITAIPESTIFMNIPVAVGWKLHPEQVVNLESASKCIQRLSQLSTKLHDHCKSIPPLSIHEPVTAAEELETALGFMSEYRLDECLGLTQQMIDIYPSVISICTQNQESAPGSEGEASVDYPFLLLAFSCHVRIIEIYEKLFQHAHKCVAEHECPVNKKHLAYQIPTVKVGSFQPPPSSAVPMLMFLLLHLASQLANHSTDLVSQLKAIKSKGGSRMGSADGSKPGAVALALAAAEDLDGKANRMIMQANSMRNKMLKAGFLA